MRPDQLNLLGRWLALAQGVIWFFILIFGGMGLIFGPAGWVAAVAGRRVPRLSAVLLIVPALVLAVSWSPIFLVPHPLVTVVASAGIVAILVVPALLAAALIVRGTRPTVSGSRDIPAP
jgi:hypothetical protein